MRAAWFGALLPAVVGHQQPSSRNDVGAHEASLVSAADGLAPADEPTIPSEAEVLAARAAWQVRVLNQEGWNDRLREHLSPEAQSARRRRMQGDEGGEPAAFAYDSSSLGRLNASELRGPAGSAGCTDQLATNYGGDICRYDCAALQEHFFPDIEPSKRRCFETGGTADWPAELLGMKQTRLDWHTFLEPAPALDTENFTIGSGDECRNVTIQTSWLEDHEDGPSTPFVLALHLLCSLTNVLPCVPAETDGIIKQAKVRTAVLFYCHTSVCPSGLSIAVEAHNSGWPGSGHAVTSTRTEVRCLMAGLHHHDHTVDDLHSVDVVGYTESGVHNESGGRTSFVVGDCTDMVIRVSTTSAGSGDVSWQIDDDGHNGPWNFVSPSGVGVWEHASCMFDNHFTVGRTDAAGDGWSGTIAVYSTVPDNTIDIPVDESWILQGTAIDGLPTILPARLTSGFAYQRPYHPDGYATGVMSHANLIIRYVRFSAQEATLDKHQTERTHSISPPARLGGALFYTGGWGAMLVIDHCVFDHLHATSGAAIMIDGQADEWARQNVTRTPEQIDDELTMTINITNTLFWELDAAWCGSAARLTDIWPLQLTFTDNQMIDNYALVSDFNWCVYAKIFDKDAQGTSINGIQGSSHLDFNRFEIAKPNSIADGRPELCPFTPGIFFAGHWDLATTAAKTLVSVEQMYCHDNHHIMRHPCFLAYNIEPCNGGCFAATVVDSVFADLWGWQKTDLWTGAGYMYVGDETNLTGTSFTDIGIDDPTESGQSEGAVGLDIDRRAVLTNVSITRGVSMIGGALVLQGPGTFDIVNCLFESNLAWQSGGAILFRSPNGGSFLSVVGSIFRANTVGLERDTEVDIVVTVVTSGVGIEPREEGAADVTSVTPLWKLDGEPPKYNVTGPTVQRSGEFNEIVDSIPDDGQVSGNETVYGFDYEVDTTYSHVIRTSPGVHRLWHGLIPMNPLEATGWKGGYIEILGVLGKTYPSVKDYRTGQDENGRVLDAGCYPALRTVTMVTNYCADGIMFWSYTDFEVPFGTGGAIATNGPGTISISDSVFESNVAGIGEAIKTVGTSNLKILNTRFLPEVTPNTLNMETTPMYDCGTHPCEPGNRCSKRGLSLWCEPCAPNQFGDDGVTCSSCRPGTKPASNRSACELCDVGKYSTVGICYGCPPGKVSTASRDSCESCPASLVPIKNRTACGCPASSYNSSSLNAATGEVSNITVQCVHHQHAPEPGCSALSLWSCPLKPPSCGTPNDDPPRECLTCNVLANDPAKTCLEMSEGRIAIAAGWSVAGAYKQDASFLPAHDWPYWLGSDAGRDLGTDGGSVSGPDLTTSDGIAPFVFRCPNPKACLPGGKCDTAAGFEGTLCASCIHDERGEYGMQPGHKCVECTLISQNAELLIVLGVIGGIVTAFNLLTEIRKRKPSKDGEAVEETANPVVDEAETFESADGTAEPDERQIPTLLGSHGVWLLYQAMLQPMRILIGYWQVVTHLGVVMDAEFPPATQTVFNSLAVLRADLESIIQLDCVMHDVTFWFIWLLRVFVVPGVMCTIVALRFAIAWKRGDATAASRAKAETFFILFLIYPGLCNRAFHVWHCRSLGNFDVLSEDYGVECYTDEHIKYRVLSSVVIVVVAFGTPLLLARTVYRRRKQYASTPVDVLMAKRAADELLIDEVIVLESIRDVASGREYSFLVNSFKSHLNYWEGIDMTRKLLLVGLLVLTGRGSILQLYLGIIITSGALILQVYFMPYKHGIDNMFKGFVEVSILITVVTALATYGTKQGEDIAFAEHEFEHSMDIYDTMLLASIGSIFVMFVLAVRSKWIMLKEVFDDSSLIDGTLQGDGYEVHVGGIKGRLEDEAVLEELFSQFGAVTSVTLRRRRNAGKLSWALIAFESANPIDRAMEAFETAESREALGAAGLVVRAVDAAKAAASTGAMKGVQERKARKQAPPPHRRAMSALQLGLATKQDMKMLSDYFRKLEDTIAMSNDVFISYREAADAPLALALFDALSDVVVPGTQKKVRCYLDQTRLVHGERWDVGFMDGLCNSTVIVPIVSAGCLAPMMKLTGDAADDAIDNVLLEWTAALELHERRDRVSAVLPLLVGGEDGGDMFADANRQFGGVDALPKAIPTATLAKLKKHLANSTDKGTTEGLAELVGNDSEEVGGDVTVCAVVKSLLLFQGTKLSGLSLGVNLNRQALSEVVERVTGAINNAQWKGRAQSMRASEMQQLAQLDAEPEPAEKE